MRDFRPVIQLASILTIAVINLGCNGILLNKPAIANRGSAHSESPNWQTQLNKVAETEIHLAQRQEQLANELAERIADLAERKIELASVLAEKKIAAKEQDLLAKSNNSVENLFPQNAKSRLGNSRMAYSSTTAQLVLPTFTNPAAKDLNQPTQTGFIFTLGDSSFVTNQVELTTNASDYLTKIALLLQKYPTYPVLITDYVASTEHRLELVQQRANLLKQILVEFGVNPQRIISHHENKNPLNTLKTTQPDCQGNHCIEIMLFNGTV
jgi:outer membrane protein OmpA-like peptidoglycan-associated protein